MRVGRGRATPSHDSAVAPRDVLCEAALKGERLAALVAHVGALAGVHCRDVPRELALLAKRLAALVTHMGALVSVHR